MTNTAAALDAHPAAAFTHYRDRSRPTMVFKIVARGFHAEVIPVVRGLCDTGSTMYADTVRVADIVLCKTWSAPVVVEVEPEPADPAEAAALASIRPDLATCRRQLLNVATAAAHDIIDAGMGRRVYRTAAVFVGPEAGRKANAFLDGRFGQTYGILHQDSRGVFVADVTDRGRVLVAPPGL